jgi:hypothetical protein
MKNTLIILALVFFSTVFAVAQKKKKDTAAPAPVEIKADQARTKNFLLKTSRFTGHTQRAVYNTKGYTGNLGQMVRYQREAKRLYEAGKYQQAIYYSRRARLFGHEALKANKAIATSDGKFSAEEETLSAGMPSDQTLEEGLLNIPTITDESLMKGNLEVDIK